jgi:hypothetical protein
MDDGIGVAEKMLGLSSACDSWVQAVKGDA